MLNAHQLAIEVHFVPLPADEADERKLRLRSLLLQGALRFVQQHTDRSQPKEPKTDETLPVGWVQR
jgi:hypothetical protein